LLLSGNGEYVDPEFAVNFLGKSLQVAVYLDHISAGTAFDP